MTLLCTVGLYNLHTDTNSRSRADADKNINLTFLSHKQRPIMMHGRDAEVVSTDADSHLHLQICIQTLSATLHPKSFPHLMHPQYHMSWFGNKFLTLLLWSRIIRHNFREICGHLQLCIQNLFPIWAENVRNVPLQSQMFSFWFCLKKACRNL